MNTNTKTFLFSWDMTGIESIIEISVYDQFEKDNLLRILKEEPVVRNPVNTIIRNILLRARFNSQRHYEVYVVNCDETLDEEFWEIQWKELPQETADLIRERGHCLYSDRMSKNQIKIV